MKPTTIFASRSLTEHFLRGGSGVLLLWLAVELSVSNPFVSLGLGITSLYLFRGCPVCWVIGLFETVYRGYAKLRSRLA